MSRSPGSAPFYNCGTRLKPPLMVVRSGSDVSCPAPSHPAARGPANTRATIKTPKPTQPIEFLQSSGQPPRRLVAALRHPPQVNRLLARRYGAVRETLRPWSGERFPMGIGSAGLYIMRTFRGYLWLTLAACPRAPSVAAVWLGRAGMPACGPPGHHRLRIGTRSQTEVCEDAHPSTH
jgi:hypothetical protein